MPTATPAPSIGTIEPGAESGMRVKQGGASDGQRFEIVGPLGSGGFGTVSEAFDRLSSERVALKELTRVSPSALFRFKQEFRALADIHHANLVRLRELFEQAGRWYIVMDLVEGSELLSFVRPSANDGPPHEGRLRQAFSGIAEGLEALHAHGVLHRDLKPSNVIVTPEGHAVLLDFGLATSVDSRGQSTHAAGVGTVLYMSPEQIDGQKLGRASDWYAFGTTLYEALTGRTPFMGESALRVAMEKLRDAPPHPNTLAAGLADDLSELAVKLLEVDAQRRPRGHDVLRVLRGEAPRHSVPSAPSPSLAPGRLFAGREAELEHLERALARTHQGELRIVLVEGESGVGKSELVAEFLRRKERNNARTLALRGRCYENEQVSYKAFDGCIDELARQLRRMGPEAASLMPAQAQLLAQLFPVLADVQTLMQARSAHVAADPTSRRLQAFAALSGLLSNLAEERPLIVVIDDLQWADGESFRLLRALVEGQTRPPVLIIATVRPREELEGEARASLQTVREWSCTDAVALYGLPHAQAEALARSLLGERQDESWASAIARESRGHPLFLAELIHFTQSRDLQSHGALTLEAALAARIERLDRNARALLEMVALAARPHAAGVFARALDLARVDGSINALLAHKFLRTRRDQEIGCFHDRVRHAVVALIPSGRVPFLHKRLALALAADAERDPTEEATHWDLAGEPERALDAYARAAAQAFEALAFNHAAFLYGRALDLSNVAALTDYARFTAARAHALACAGRSAEAADLYQRAADMATTEEQRLRLRSRTALQLMLSGKLQRGLDASRQLFASLGVTIPKSDWAAIALSLWHRLRTRFRKDGLLAIRRADATRGLVLELLNEQLPVFASARLSAYLAVSAQYARLALAYGDLRHASKAYADEGWLRNANSGATAAVPLFELASKLGARAPDDARLHADLASVQGSARLSNLQWSEGAELLQTAQDLYQAHVADQPWQLTYVRHMLGTAWFCMGEHGQLAHKLEEWIQEARERKDQLGFALLVGMGYGCLRHLMRGRPEDAQAELEEAMAPLQSEPFSFAHFGELLVIPYVHALRGGRAAWDWFEQRRALHDATLLLKTRFGREGLLIVRSHAALSACQGAAGSAREQFLAAAERDLRALKRGGSPSGVSTADALAAGIAIARGDLESALGSVRSARVHFERTGHPAHWASYVEGRLEGGDSGAARCKVALEFFAGQGWTRAEDAIATLAPAAALLGEGRASAGRRHEQPAIRHYKVLGSLGHGGFGRVVEARDTRSGEHVALKELVSKGARALERFKQEFRALRDLNHPNLVRLHALFEQNGQRYIAMELVRGQDLLGYVRPEGMLDPARLRRAFAGLVAGVRALHEAGLVHRDISSDNVLVNADGRAVLLDFGLLAREHDDGDSGALGNVSYAAPEQLDGAVPLRSADAYALGVCLYQGLSGELPIALTPGNASLEKRRARPAAPQVPPELASLLAISLRLMAAEPGERPALRELAELLTNTGVESAGQERSPSLALARLPTEGAHFRGRQAELARLAQAREAAERGFALVLVEGESGLGKSALVAEFVRQEEARAPTLCCLTGRCYENEQLAFKAFDGVVDELARYLRGLPALECAALLPKKSALLSQLFPVLGTVPGIADAPQKGLPADPGARRAAAVVVFIELLEQLARTRPVLLAVDDLQWADADSVALITALSARAEALPLLLLATVRPPHEVPPSLELAGLRSAPSTRTIVLRGLEPGEARALARSLIDMEVPEGLLEQLAAGCQGHPLFLRELVELTKARGASFSSGVFTLDEAFAARIGRFSPAQQRLLALVALAGKPYPAHVFATASAAPEDALRSAVDELLNQGLLRRRGDTSLACYHDRVRHVALTLLTPERNRELSGRLASALDQHEPHESAERARLWDQAEQRDSALAAHEQAGDTALAKLAFAQAERHYARALELAGEARDERWQRLVVQRAHALSRGGHAAQAAQLYKAASETAQGELAVRLRVWAAQHLIHSAQVDEGLAVACALFKELGEPLHLHDGSALGSIVWDRLCIQAAGLAMKPPRASKNRERERILLEVMPDLGLPVNWVSFLGGTALSLSHLRRALRFGDPEHGAQALAIEGMIRASLWRKNWRECFERAAELLRAVDNPTAIATVDYLHGVALLTAFDFEHAAQRLTAAHKVVEEQCQGQRFLLTQVRSQLGTAWWWLGRHRELAHNMQAWIDEAKELHDLYALTSLCGVGCGSLRWLMRDEPERALEELESALAPWPRTPFSWGRWGALYCMFAVHLYRSGGGGHVWFQSEKSFLSKQAIMKADFSRPVLEVHEAVLALHAIERVDTSAARALIKRAEPLMQKQRRHRSPWFRAGGEETSAILQAVRGQRAAALEHARRARQEYATAPVGDYWKRGEYLLARIEGGADGQARCQTVHTFLASEGWHKPERMLAMYLPCLHLLDD